MRDARGVRAAALFDTVPGIQRQLAAAVRRTCPSWLADRADDLVQTALLKLMDRMERSEGNQEVSSSYLWKVAYSAVIDEIRRERRRQEVPLEDEAVLREPVAREPDPESRASARRIGAGILDCLRKMIEPRRLAVTLHLQGHTVPEIGRLLGWKAKRADNLVYRGLADLRVCLEEKGLKP
jgi:RNA polymerase sigma-70 factor (ECF subfamily)